MDISLIGAASEAFAQLLDPFRLFMLASGVILGLLLGIVPGIGGMAGMALLLPFTYAMDSYAAFAMLLGMAAVVGTSDTIPAVLFGVPGTVGAQATILDGNPIAKRGEAGRALSAAFTASLMGGLIGAALLALTIPLLRPVMFHIRTPELLAFSLFGISMVAMLSGSAPLRGLIAAGLGIMLSMVGSDPLTGLPRWSMGTTYLWDGLPIVPMVLGLFALPEVADLAIRRQAIASDVKMDTRAGMAAGFRDAMRNWWLITRCGGIGAGIGAVPGLGAAVVDWIAYGYALQSVKDADKTFGKGDVRGVIAPESANNAITAGSLVPTIAFGVPGSAPMAILLSVFLIHGLVPGPDMLTVNLSNTYAMVWSIAIANILGAGICFMFSGQFARIALLRYTLILPAVITFVYIGAFQESRSWGDIYTLLLFAVLGWTMKQLRWSRPPLILGFVLGALIERYMFTSFARYDFEWMVRPIVLVLFAICLLVMLRPMIKHFRSLGGVRGIVGSMRAPRFRARDLFYVFVFLLVGAMVLVASGWSWDARVGPMIVGVSVLVLCTVSFLNQAFTRAVVEARGVEPGAPHAIHMDATFDFGELEDRTILLRSAAFLGYLLLFPALMAVLGFLPSVAVFAVIYMRIEGPERWRRVLIYAGVLTVLMWAVFDRLLAIPWPGTLLGQWFPVLTVIPSM